MLTDYFIGYPDGLEHVVSNLITFSKSLFLFSGAKLLLPDIIHNPYLFGF